MTEWRRTRNGVGVALLTLVVGGAAGSSSGGGVASARSLSAASPRACSAQLAADVRAVTGGTVTVGRPGKEANFTSCSYHTPRGTIYYLVTDWAAIHKQQTSVSSAGAYFSETRAGVLGKSQTVHLGTSAYYVPAQGELWVQKGNVVFSLLQAPPKSTTLAFLTQVAKRMLPHA